MESDLTQSEIQDKTTKPKRVAKVKETFEATCEHCSKVFKSNKLYEPHVKEQKCFKPDEITYCKICDITAETPANYRKHLITMEHLNNIGFNTQERLKTKEENPVFNMDPYLNDNDVNKITKSNLGSGFTFVLDSGETKTITLKQNPIPETILPSSSSKLPSTSPTTSLPTSPTTTKNSRHTETHSIVKPIARKPSPPVTPPEVIATERQQKILDVVLKLSKNTNIEACSGKFYKILDEKMQIDDYKGFQMLINKLNISDEHKDSYIRLIGNYLSHLIALSSKGTAMYKDKDISQMVINLSY